LRFLLEALCESEPMRVLDAGGDPLLSKREQDVVRCVAEGLSNREIANRLRLTEHTVKNYLFRIFDKLGVSSRVEVVLYAFRFRKDLIDASTRYSDDTATGSGRPAKPSRPGTGPHLAMKRPMAPVEELARRV
jgi:DNA-binding CsgD family transcriptional regulator